MLIYSFITDYQAFSLRYKDNTTRDKNETKVGKQSANLGKNNEPIQNRLSFLIDCKSVILHHLTILLFPMVRPAWDNWWITSTSFGRYYPVNGAAGGENVGAGVIPALTPQKIKNIWHGCGMITVTGVRAGINPALRWMMSLPMEKLVSSDSSEVDFCCVSFLFFCLSPVFVE